MCSSGLPLILRSLQAFRTPSCNACLDGAGALPGAGFPVAGPAGGGDLLLAHTLALWSDLHQLVGGDEFQGLIIAHPNAGIWPPGDGGGRRAQTGGHPPAWGTPPPVRRKGATSWKLHRELRIYSKLSCARESFLAAPS